ncbi:acyl-CoA dehydrogenase [Rhodococcus aerolatus]
MSPAERLRELVAAGDLDLPLPGSGATAQRWDALTALARDDVVLGRLAEAHLDADAILAELTGRRVGPGQVWGVWAAEPPEPVLRAVPHGDGWRLHGTKAWCSGASSSTHALLTARTDDGPRLLDVGLDHPGVTPVPGTWPAVGMARSDSGHVAFDDVPAATVGGPRDYLDRPGFWHGAAGVAACWLGGAAGVADALLRPGLTEHGLAHLGAVTAALGSARALLLAAAAEVDADPGGDGRARALAVRAAVEAAAMTALERTGRALGAGPLCADAAHATRVADLTVYLRQSHAERDLATLGTAVLDRGALW